MKIHFLFGIILLFSSCHTGVPVLNGGHDKTFVIVQRNSADIEGSKEKLEFEIGDITMNTTEVKITGHPSNKVFLDAYMRQNDKEVIDYYGSFYTVELSQIENHLIHDDKAEFKIKAITTEEADKLQKEKGTIPSKTPTDSSIYKKI